MQVLKWRPVRGQVGDKPKLHCHPRYGTARIEQRLLYRVGILPAPVNQPATATDPACYQRGKEMVMRA